MAQRQFRSDDTDKWIYGFGDGSAGDGSINTSTDAPIDSACSGTSGTNSLSATNASFTAGQLILIHQTRGTGAGGWELNKIASYTAGTITTQHALTMTYTNSGASVAQVIVMKQYNDLTINNSQTLTAKAWDGTVGGIIAYFVKGTATVTGNISASGKGYRGGTGTVSQAQAQAGEGTSGAATAQNSANGNGGGGGVGGDAMGGGGGNGTAGTTGGAHGTPGVGGGTAGTAALTTMVFGGASGAGANNESSPVGGSGKSGGGIVLLIAKAITISGTIVSAGQNGSGGDEGSGSSAGGSVLVKAQTATLGTTKITASGGTINTGWGGVTGGTGGDGRIHIDYKTSYTGTTTPTIDATQDATLDYASSGGGAFLFNLI